MATENPTGSGCLATLFMIIVALLVSTHALTTPLISDVPPTPSEAVMLQFSANATADQQQATVDIISQRLTALGITPDVQLQPGQGDSAPTIRVLLPGGDNFQAALDLISQPGDFELVDLSGLNPTDYQDVLIWTTHQAEMGAVHAADARQHPETNQPFTTVLDNTHLMKAEVVVDGELGTWTINAIFDQEGGGILGIFTAAHIGEPLAIVVDGRVLSAPVIEAPITGEAAITGNFTLTEARQLAAKIGFGALPVPLELISLS
ncbi:MAG: hypothetical protein ABI700_23635 [Chloroflexota bacterium]